jgi:ribose transport system permease protein
VYPRRILTDSLGLLAALGVLILAFGLATDHFLSPTNFRTIANQVPSAMLVATGMTFVLVLGQIDLSVGSVLALSGAVLGAAMTRWHWPLAAAIPAALLTGAACGAFNAAVSLRWRLPTFIVTLGMLEIARGAAHAVTQSQTLYLGSAIGGLAGASVSGLSAPFLLALLVVALAHLLLTRTVFGRHAIAVGTNEEAARLCGIDPRPIRFAVFTGTGVLVALAALIDTSRFESANPNAGTGLELQAIAAVVIGGTSLLGGRGSVIATFLGVLIIAVLNSGLAAVGARDELKRVITGAVILAAVILDAYRRHHAPRTLAARPQPATPPP